LTVSLCFYGQISGRSDLARKIDFAARPAMGVCAGFESQDPPSASAVTHSGNGRSANLCSLAELNFASALPPFDKTMRALPAVRDALF